jgi:hypothetical protein
MKWFLGAMLTALLVAALGVPAGAADEKDAKAILDKAIKALGGEEKLSKAKAFTWKSKGKLSFGGMESEFTTTSTAQGLDHHRSTFEGELGGIKYTAMSGFSKDKGWRQFMGETTKLEGDELANEKRRVYLQVLPMTLLPLKDKGFKLEPAGEKKVGDKPAVGLKVTAPDGKDFTLFFDKDSGLPVLLVAKAMSVIPKEGTQETTFADYKEFAGIKKATKTVTKHDGQPFLESQITEFKVLDKVDPKTFEEPK